MTSIQSNFDVSGLHINPDLKVVDEFRTIVLTGAGSNGVRITPMDSQSAVSGAQELKSGNVEVNTAEEVYNAQEVADRWIFGKIVAVNSGKTDWCYKACIKCPKKFETKTGDLYSCKRCKITFENPKDRYKVEVVAFDGTTCITLLLWDRECKYLVGMEAADLLQLVDENLEEHPTQLDNLLEKKLLFKLSVKSSNIDGGDLVYPVSKICDDDDMVQKYQPIEFDTDPCVGSPDVKASNTMDGSGPVVSLGSDHDTQLYVGTGEASVTSIKTKTFSKMTRTSLKPCIQGKDEKDKGQTSTNRFCKKGEKKNVKRARVIFDDTSD
ncbi:hypothetical protein PIB30_001968 [Stylosanthes scabra]|uniref:Replication factor A C-terminal domain-containing protein n=1 Tax=Stylosanthes scabra TaxID=79078 RepID=A0ABU6Z1L7_9FABA|nr:hypothetical protein [Stylosanthes scabra]